MTRSRRPSVRRCPRCGGQHCAWDERALCSRCKRETAGDAGELASMVRAARAGRAAAAAVPLDAPATARRPLFGEFPEGF